MVLEDSNSQPRRRFDDGPDSSRRSKRPKLVSDDDYMLAGYLVALSKSSGRKPSPPPAPAPARANPYKCSVCDKGFPSHQALGGHKASHRSKQPLNAAAAATDKACNNYEGGPHPISGGRHQCSTCGRSFGTGQQLGGHMRKHYVGAPKIGANSSEGGHGGDESSIVTSYSGSGGVSYSDGGELTHSPRNYDFNWPPISSPSPSPELDLTLKL